MSIEINKTGIIVRPSSLNTFLGCSYQWAKVFIGGQPTIPNSRAAIGTGIHGGAEALWLEAQIKGSADELSLEAAQDAAVNTFNEEVDRAGVAYDEDEDANTATREIRKGVEAFLGDIVPFAEIPTHVEKRFTKSMEGHPLISAISGTMDYYAEQSATQADIKTSKRASSVSSHVIQQSTYKILAESEGHTVDKIFIHNVVLTKTPTGSILELEPRVDQARFVINSLLELTELLVEDRVRPEVLFRGNPTYMFCSNKYCTLYRTCPFVNGTADPTSNDVKTLEKETIKVRNNSQVVKL